MTMRETAIASLLLLAALMAWIALRRIDPEAASQASSDRSAAPPAAADEHPASVLEPAAAPWDGRVALRTPASSGRVEEAVAAFEPERRVRVHGRVWSQGRPVEGVALAFVRWEQESMGDEVDWDFSDEDGNYEVRVPAARYRLVSNDEEGSAGDILVPSGVEVLAWDIHLSMPSTEPGGRAARNR